MTYQQLIFSDTAVQENLSNTPGSLTVIRNLQQLCDFITALEQILGVQLTVNSGYRSAKLNEIVGGSENSYHMFGLAADLTISNNPRCTLTDLKNLCLELRKTRLAEVVVHERYVHIAIKPYNYVL